MSRFSQSLEAVFEAYGDDAEAGLQAFGNTDPPAYAAYVDAAAAKQYRADHGTYRRSALLLATKDIAQQAAGQAHLFDPGPSTKRVDIRRILVLDGVEYDIATLSGTAGAEVVRRVAERDLAPATTTIERCRYMLQAAEHVAQESDRLGRDVSFGEVLGLAVAA